MIISKTPFRISFFGGGTDIDTFYVDNGGAVLSTSINKYMYITVNKRFDDKIRISYSRTETVDSINEVQHDIVREALRLVGIERGIEITSISDIPKGTGLGSSSAFAVGLLNALYMYQGAQVSAEKLAMDACKIEIDILGAPIGKQDQYAVAYGGMNLFEFLPGGNVVREKITLDNESYLGFNSKLSMFYTGGQRSANKVLEKQRKAMPGKEAILSQMKDQAYEQKELLASLGLTDKFGYALNRAWKLKSSISEGISNLEIDKSYKAALDAGALGGKLLGAGGGGFLLFYANEEDLPKVCETLGLRKFDFALSRYGSRIICCD